METGDVRRQLLAAIERSKRAAQERRQQASVIDAEYQAFLRDVATPLLRQLASALKASGYSFVVSTPEGSVRLSSERTRDDYVEVALASDTTPPEVVVRTSLTRGSRTLSDERPVSAGAPPSAISEHALLAFLLQTLEPWLER